MLAVHLGLRSREATEFSDETQVVVMTHMSAVPDPHPTPTFLRTGYVIGVTGLAAVLGLTGTGSMTLWLLLFLLTAPSSFVLAPAAATLLVGLGAAGSASFSDGTSMLIQALMATLWVASWSGIATLNAALLVGRMPASGSHAGAPARAAAESAVPSAPAPRAAMLGPVGEPAPLVHLVLTDRPVRRREFASPRAS